MYYNKVEICGVNTAKLKTLSSADTRTLLCLSRAGDMEARQKLIDGNLRLVLSIVQRFAGRYDNMDDLFQVGCIGLLKAVDHFDTTMDVQLSTYACPLIIGEVRRFLRDSAVIRVSRSVRDLAYKILQCKEAMTAARGLEPAMEEIAKEMGLSVEEVSGALDAIAAPVSLYDPVYSEGGDPLTVMDQVRDTRSTDERWIEHLDLKDAFAALTPREQEILSLRFFDGKTQMEVAGKVGISQAQVSRLEKGAINAMRKRITVS